jgi:hypothetical protein
MYVAMILVLPRCNLAVSKWFHLHRNWLQKRRKKNMLKCQSQNTDSVIGAASIPRGINQF